MPRCILFVPLSYLSCLLRSFFCGGVTDIILNCSQVERRVDLLATGYREWSAARIMVSGGSERPIFWILPFCLSEL
jgi:hypothetical protein